MLDIHTMTLTPSSAVSLFVCDKLPEVRGVCFFWNYVKECWSRWCP